MHFRNLWLLLLVSLGIISIAFLHLPVLRTFSNRGTNFLSPSLREEFDRRLRCWTRGSWELEAVKNDIPLFFSNNISSAFYWVTNSCKTHPFRRMDNAKFCQLLNGRHLVLLGDSLSQHWAVLLQLTNSTTARSREGTLGHSQFVVLGAPLCISSGHPAHLSLLKNWQITSDDVPGWEPGLDSFFKMVRNVSNSSMIAVVNRGAHYTPNDQFLHEVRRVLRHVTTQSGVSTVVWRNTPPGHVNCTSYDGPISSPQPESGLPYNWGHFREQNRLVEVLLQTEFPFVWHMDVYAATVLRPDGHSNANDCLHYKMAHSIPLIHWTRLFYNMLAEAAELGLYVA